MSNKDIKQKHAELNKLVEEAKKKENGGQVGISTYTDVLNDVDDPPAPPEPNEAMFYGLVGKVAKIAATGTEVNPVSAAAAFLSFLGANAGRDSFLLIGNTYHHPRLFTLHIGRSSRGGKGDSQQLTHRIRRLIEEQEPGLLGLTHTGGLSSGEGLAALIHDGYKEKHGNGYKEKPGIKDKRLWIIESEFANVLHKIRREGNVLSSSLRDSWDGSNIDPAVKNRRMGVKYPHVGLHANITPFELKKLMSSIEMSNGFGNRFLMLWAENIGCVPFPEPTENRIVEQLAAETIEIIQFMKGGYPDTRNSLGMYLSVEAKRFFEVIYPQLKEPLENEIMSGMLSRRPPYIMRLAMLFALTDKSRVIERCHMEAAYTWVQYATDTVKFVFYNPKISEQSESVKRNAGKILAYLEEKQNPCSLSQISSECFKGNLESTKIRESLQFLLSENPPLIENIKQENRGRGRKKVLYRIKKVTKKTKKFADLEPRGLQQFSGYEKNTKKYELIKDEVV